MKRILILCLTAALTACGGSGGGAGAPAPSADDPCSATGQKQFVLDVMRDWYLWNNLLPADVNINDFVSAESLLAFLASFQPIDGFSRISDAAQEQAFFNEGEFEGYGFSSRFTDSNVLRIVRVFEGSPAWDIGIRRGQQIVQLNGRSIANIEANEGVGALFDLPSLEFTMRNLDGSEFTATASQAIVTIDPIPQYRIIDAGDGRRVGYIEFYTFIRTANAQLDEAFNEFRLAGVNDVILDLRYNGGGLVSVAEQLGDLLGGDQDSLVFSETRFNEDRAPSNNSTEFFERRGASISLSKLAVIASRGTASASELVTNSMEPYVVGGVGIIGDNTFGKPVGQSGFTFCEKILRPTTFQTVNAAGFGDYFDGIPVDCSVPDDLDFQVGASDDPNVVAALEYLQSGGCPVTAVPGGQAKPTAADFVPPRPELRGSPKREYLDAW